MNEQENNINKYINHTNKYKINTNKCILHEKKNLRRQMLAIRDSIPQTLREEKSRRILDRLYQCTAYQGAEQILSYVSFRSEADTMPLLKRALGDGKKLYCPFICGGEMVFYRVRSLSELSSGSYGILEPPAKEENRFCGEQALRAGQSEAAENSTQILMVLPGAVFDKRGFRIGYGGGYYDKYLANMGELREKGVMTAAALLFLEQLVEELPGEAHDLPVDLLITEERVIYTAESKIKNS